MDPRHSGAHLSWVLVAHNLSTVSLVPSLSAPQIFIAYSMKNRGAERLGTRLSTVTANSKFVVPGESLPDIMSAWWPYPSKGKSRLSLLGLTLRQPLQVEVGLDWAY